MSKEVKYAAIEQAISILFSAGYGMKDPAYIALTSERARLETDKPGNTHKVIDLSTKQDTGFTGSYAECYDYIIADSMPFSYKIVRI